MGAKSPLSPSKGVGVIGGETPYTKIGWWVGLEKFRLRAAYFLRAEKVGKDALRGGGPDELRAFASLRRQPIGPAPLRTPITGDSTWTLALAAGARTLAATPFPRRPLRPDPADEKPPALARRRLGVGADGVGK